MQATERDVSKILDAYFKAVFFTDSGDTSDEISGDEEISAEAERQAKDDIVSFLETASALLTEAWTDEQIGHDFWLTRNGHGSGFWDRGLPNGDELSKAAEGFGSVWAYKGDDGLLYFSE